MPYNPFVVLKKLATKRKHALSLEISLSTILECLSSVLVLKTSANVDQVSQIDDFISQFRHQILDTLKLALLSKLIRKAKLVMTDCIILNKTNAKFYKYNLQKKNEAIIQINSMMRKRYNILT